MNNTGKYKIIGITLLLMAVSMFTWALQHHYFKAKETVVTKQADTVHKTFVYDKALLAKFVHLGKKYDSLGKADFTMAGVINMIDKADTAGKLTNVNFLICKAGSEFYYKMGATETINANGVCLLVDNKAKRIMLYPQKEVGNEADPTSFTGLSDQLRTEEYTMTDKIAGDQQTITFNNETHVSCKQYSVTFDPIHEQLKHLYVRFTNLQYPLRRDKEKVLDVAIAEFDGRSDLKRYLSRYSVVKKDGDKWSTVGRFAKYELIIRL